MLQITISKSRSKNYNVAIARVIQLGGHADGKGAILEIPEYALLNAYHDLFQLVQLIGKWKGVTTTFRDNKVNLYRFIFTQYNQVATCGVEKIKSFEESYCLQQGDHQTFGCRKINSILLTNSGSGYYERSGRYWYNYGVFNQQGIWEIDKSRIMVRIMNEVEEKALDVCPFFDIEAVMHRINKDLPAFIIPDNYNYRLHYEKQFVNGAEIYQAVNIRHIGSKRDAPGTINKRLLNRLKSAFEYFKALPPEPPDQIKEKLMQSMEEIPDVDPVTIHSSFDKDGICRN